MAKEKSEYKIGVRISPELYKRLNKHFEWGEKSRIITHVLEWMCDKVEELGPGALMVFLRGGDLLDIIKKEEEKEDGDNR